MSLRALMVSAVARRPLGAATPTAEQNEMCVSSVRARATTSLFFLYFYFLPSNSYRLLYSLYL